MQRDRLGDGPCPILSLTVAAQQLVRRSCALDREACRGAVAPVVIRCQAEVVQHTRQVEQLLVVSNLIALSEEHREGPCAQTVGMEYWGRQFTDALLGES